MEDHKSTTEVDKMDHEHEVILPGFRFHPTDEELVGFYLKKKIQHRILPIELIKQVDIYKYDPWDLPNLAPSGEKEWYFYCPRYRKYKNSARPNRVTGAGFWKATGTDRPIYSSSNDSKCIGLKKSLVFYRGRASKGIKTDWMMHEFRLPSLIEPKPDNKIQEKHHPNDAWAICRIFKKTSSMAQRVISHAWASSINEDRITSDFLSSDSYKFNPDYNTNISCMNDHHLRYTKPASMNGFSGLETALYRSTNPGNCKTSSTFPLPYMDFSSGFVFSSADHADMKDISKNWGRMGEEQGLDNVSVNHYRDHEVGNVRSGGVPFSLPVAVDDSDEWKLKRAWDEYSPPCPSDQSTTYSTNNYQNIDK